MLDARYSTISKKWVGFVTAIWVQSIAGNNYTFANYSPALKAVMHYNQLQLNNLGVAKDVGKSFGLLAGLLADRLPTWLILLIGAVEGAVGYGTQYLVIAQKISPPSYWQVGSPVSPTISTFQGWRWVSMCGDIEAMRFAHRVRFLGDEFLSSGDNG